MDLNFLWPLIGGAFGAAMVNSAFAFYKQKSDARLETDQWRRDQRQISYSSVISAADLYVSTVTDTREGILKGAEAAKALVDTQGDFLHAGRQVLLTAPPELVDCLSTMKDMANDMADSLQRQASAEDGDERNASWEAVTQRYTRAATDFLLMARHDLGMHGNDSQAKSRAALVKFLKSGRMTWHE